jgi:hypothetical protein
VTTHHDPEAEAAAARRYTIINAVRFAAIGAAGLGIAITRGAVPGPYALGAVLAVAGVAAFFSGPYILVKRWKAQDQAGE